MNIPKVLGTAFFIEQLWWLLLNYVLVSENNFKKNKVSGEIAFELISLFHLQIQELTSKVNYQESICLFLQNLLNFIITKYLSS